MRRRLLFRGLSGFARFKAVQRRLAEGVRLLGVAAPLVMIAANAWAAEPSADAIQRGKAIYQSRCASCHGAQGAGTESYPTPLAGDKAIGELTRFVVKTMPEGSPEECVGDDAALVTQYIYHDFYSPAAQQRLHPPVVQFARLTVRQIEQTLCDLVGSFGEQPAWTDERGLQALVFGDRRTKSWSEKTAFIKRIDAELAFDLGEGRPEGLPPRDEAQSKQFSPLEYGIRWQGSVIAPETGDYELIIETCNGVRLWLDRYRASDSGTGYNLLPAPLVDAMVPNGEAVVHRATVRLLGGRAYPIWLDFIRFLEPTSHLRLKWKRPGHAEEVIPARFLMPVQVPHPFVPETAFPPDDRNEGYVRGTSISQAWQEAVMAAAMETASHVVRRTLVLADVNASDSPQDRAEKIRDFCERFVERAFRRPLTADEKRQFVADRMRGVREDAGVRRVVLMAILSPRFLYREHGKEGFDNYAVASWLSFGLWDSLPDETLLQAAAAGRLQTREQLAAQVDRMLGDPRTLAKLREFTRQWLQLDQFAELTKDSKTYPEFDARMTSDLRTSLELFIDDVLASPDASLRRLLLDDQWYVNDRLARFYGLEPPQHGGFEKVAGNSTDGLGRAGVLLHPLLLSRFAYPDSSSPIHRGVFIVRNILGRSLKAPPDNVEPDPVDADAARTTRERVALQTSATTCQACHSAINGIGFSLEHFDAVGRYRPQEFGQPIDASGTYLDRDGNEVKFSHALELAEFLADSPECRTAFTEQLFHYTIKQPIGAFGANRLAELSGYFSSHELNIRRLLHEIVVSSALQMTQFDPPDQTAAAR